MSGLKMLSWLTLLLPPLTSSIWNWGISMVSSRFPWFLGDFHALDGFFGSQAPNGSTKATSKASEVQFGTDKIPSFRISKYRTICSNPLMVHLKLKTKGNFQMLIGLLYNPTYIGGWLRDNDRASQPTNNKAGDFLPTKVALGGWALLKFLRK